MTQAETDKRRLDELTIVEAIAFAFIGQPYKWGGDDPMAGFDCSGFVIELLKSVGKLTRSGDWTAAMLWESLSPVRRDEPYKGCLVFWKNSHGSVIHVEYCLDERLAIGASGGGSSTVTVQDAINRNAYIKVRPIKSRANIAGYADPWG